MMTDLYCIGEMLIDFIPGAEPGSYLYKAGGAPANVAIAAAKNGLNAAMCCKVGDDGFGQILLDTLRQYGVRAACTVPCGEATTTLAFVTLLEGGERRFTFARKPGADMMLAEDEVRAEDIRDSVFVHAGSCSLSAQPEAAATVRALELGHQYGKLISFDVNYRAPMWNGNEKACIKAVLDLLQYVDLLKISEEEVDLLGGIEAIEGLMRAKDITLVVETLGSHGAKAFFGGKTLTVSGKKVKAIDATGAGDAFWGAFLSKLRLSGVEKAGDLTEKIIHDALEYGNVSGSICVQQKGAIDAIPTRAQIEACMKS